MNNGVENNQTTPTAVPILTPVGQPSTPVATTPATVPATAAPATAVMQTPTVPATPGTSFSVPTTSSIPATVPPSAPPTAAPVMVATQPATVPVTVPETTAPTTPVVEEKKEEEKPKKKKRFKLVGFLLFLLICLGAYTFYLYQSSHRTITELKYSCSPIAESKETIYLDVNSTLVQDLYQKVATSVREDYAQPEWNNQMRIYLAYRQIPDYLKYDSNCNYFESSKMEPYTCEVSTTFIPKAFKVSTLELEWKKLYGDATPMPKINVNLANTCVGGYEYVPERQEYVEGYCSKGIAISVNVKKKLEQATFSNNMIVLKEHVQYEATEDMEIPSYLRNGDYYYTFRLDMNYNYIFINKTYDYKY